MPRNECYTKSVICEVLYECYMCKSKFKNKSFAAKKVKSLAESNVGKNLN
jgi:hypothetical protein